MSSISRLSRKAAVEIWHFFQRSSRDYRGLLLFLLLMCGFRSAWADWVYVPSGSMNVVRGQSTMLCCCLRADTSTW